MNAARSAEAFAHTEITDYLLGCIRDDWHCIVFVDDHHLRGCDDPFVREVLLFGHDGTERVFRALAFGKRKVFGRVRMGCDDLARPSPAPVPR
ncbi:MULTISPECIES: hypothetical protein [Streptomyces]|uniref:hypothetical protein n=1 Tax=Streptomyces TaxID=1883 RepID=UPI0004AAA91A|nr:MULTISPECIES: hypothetical protein [Streptomyces]